MQELQTFVSLVIRRTSAYLTGGVVAAAVVVGEHLTGKSLSWNAVRAGLAVFLLVAVYRVWRDERRRADELERRSTLRTDLGQFLARGQELASRLSWRYGPTQEMFHLQVDDDVQAWVSEVEGYLEQQPALGTSYVARFRQDAAFPISVHSIAPGNLQEWCDAYEHAMQQRCRNLAAFIMEA